MPDQPPSDRESEPRVVRPRLRAPGAGRPRKSAAMHLLEGTRSRARRGAPAPADKPVRDDAVAPELLTPPAWMHAYSKAFWLKNAAPLARAGRLKLHHLGAWTALCERFGTFERASRGMAKESLTSKRYPKLAAIARQACQQYGALCLRFGIDPATDMRLSAMDGGDVTEERAAVVAPAAAAEPDRGDAWLREHRSGG